MFFLNNYYMYNLYKKFQCPENVKKSKRIPEVKSIRFPSAKEGTAPSAQTAPTGQWGHSLSHYPDSLLGTH